MEKQNQAEQKKPAPVAERNRQEAESEDTGARHQEQLKEHSLPGTNQAGKAIPHVEKDCEPG
jgi:hypothetical protein